MAQGEDTRRWLPWLGLGLAGALIVCSVPVVVAMAFLDRGPGAEASTSPRPVSSPLPGDPESVAQLWLRERMTDVLNQQAAALLRGDERGFLAAAAAKSPAVAVLRRQYRSLRALQVTVWQPRISDLPTRAGAEWAVTVSFGHCFGASGCRAGRVAVPTRWVESAGVPRLVAVEPSPSAQDGPRPWEVSDLVVAAGRRTVVATTAAQKGRLATLLSEAEQAATVADRYAVDGTPPDRYLIFYAGDAEWKRWYGGGRPDWTAGYAVPIGSGHFDVVLGARDLHSTILDDLLRHEMTHASSLPDEGYRTGANWWLVEGVADHAAAGGRPVNRYESLPDVRKLVAGGWRGPLASAEPGAGAADWQVSGAYGIGYLAVRHLVDRYGLSDVLAFFKAVVHERHSLEQASTDVFGEKWQVIHDNCVSYIVSTAS